MFNCTKSVIQIFTILIVTILATVTGTVFAECPGYYAWVVGSGNWSTPGNWLHPEWDPYTASCPLLPGVPLPGHTVNVCNGGIATLTGEAVIGQIIVDANGQVDLNNGSLFAQKEAIGVTGNGTFIQDGGTNIQYGDTNAPGFFNVGCSPGSNGIYELHHGQIYANSELIGSEGNGAFVQTDGNNVIAGLLAVGVSSGADGYYQLDGGHLSAQIEQIGGWGDGTFIQNGGTNASQEYIIAGLMPGSNGRYEFDNGQISTGNLSIGHEGIGTFVQTDGNAIANDLRLGIFSGSNGQYQLDDGSVSAQREQIGNAGHGVFTQNGGTNTSQEYFIVGNVADSNGRYELRHGRVWANSENIGNDGIGTFVQTDGNNVISNELSLGVFSGSDGQYQLDGGSVSAQREQIGVMGDGTFVQNGGTNASQDYMLIGSEADSNGRYELCNGQVSADSETIGSKGTGTFVQTGGTNSITNDLTLGSEPDSQGQYELLGGTLNVGHIEVASEGTGTFVMNGGTINGSTEDSEIFVNSNRGSLTGPGTFNITVIYDKIYGTEWNQGVILLFNPNCLFSGGLYNVSWTTPDYFAGGMVQNLLPSSVFNINFNGSHCGQFKIAIPYTENEVRYYDANELKLLLLQETGPDTYKQISDVEIDTENNIIFADCNSFGKYAVAVPHQYIGGGGGLCPAWYLGNLDRDCDVDYDDLAILAENWLKDELSADIAPIGGDGIVNMPDFAVLAKNWFDGN